ncbi:hypothetical protein ACFQ9X_30525 [Catenulispora yoronensis]
MNAELGAVRGDGIFGSVAGAAFGVVADAVRDATLDSLGSVVGAAVGAVRDAALGGTGSGSGSASGTGTATTGTRAFLDLGIHSVIAVAKAAGDLGLPPWTLDIVTDGGHRVLPGDQVRPEQALVLGPCRLIPVEYPGVRTRLIDVQNTDAKNTDARTADFRAADVRDTPVGPGPLDDPAALRALVAELRSNPTTRSSACAAAAAGSPATRSSRNPASPTPPPPSPSAPAAPTSSPAASAASAWPWPSAWPATTAPTWS